MARRVRKVRRRRLSGKEFVAAIRAMRRRGRRRVLHRGKRNPNASVHRVPASETAAWRRVQNIAATIERYAGDRSLRDLAFEIVGVSKEMLDQLKAGVHRNPMLAVVGANPSTRGARKIGYVREIRYIRGPGLRHAGQRFKHVFKTREACIYTLRDGSLLIRG